MARWLTDSHVYVALDPYEYWKYARNCRQCSKFVDDVSCQASALGSAEPFTRSHPRAIVKQLTMGTSPLDGTFTIAFGPLDVSFLGTVEAVQGETHLALTMFDRR